jgi:hypothetical protein
MTNSTRTDAPQDPSAATSARTSSLWLIGGMILVAALFRMLPSPEVRPPNVAPIGAMALLGGAAITDRRLAFAIPLVAMLISDVLIGFDGSRVWVYGSLVLITLLGRLLQNRRRNPAAVGLGSLGASLVFFILTNFGVWWSSGMYGHTFSELIRCYVMAIPFFGNTVVGDLAFSGALFGGLALVESRIPSSVPASADS